tara:strand:+ start:207 stop:1244 length:1038 start_codon:yes stop_codon:yes gene_type:complete
MKEFNIGKTKIGKLSKPFIIAELSANHGNSLKNCLKLVKLAKAAGASAIKIQTYRPDTITLKSNKKDFLLKKNSPWKKYDNMWNLYSKSFTPWEWHKAIFKEAKKNKLEFFSSPFDESAVDFLKNLNVKAYKIASAEINHIPMIEKIIKLNKPIIFSLGFSNLKNYQKINMLIKKYKFKKAIFLNCIADYPASIKDFSFYDFDNMKKKHLVGLSDHTIGNQISTISLLKGACVFEKHICLSKKETIDDFFSADYLDFKSYVDNLNLTYSLMKNINSNFEKNKHSINKRSIYVSQDINVGNKFNEDNIKIVRPGNSLDPELYFKIIGKKTLKKLKVGDRISLKNVK